MEKVKISTISSADWQDSNYKMPLLLFAQTILESLDELSYDSYQIPTLNIRSFCFDFLRTLDYIDKGIIQEGNMVPLVEEFEFYCQNDYITERIIRDDVCLLLRKTPAGHFEKIHDNLELKAKIKIYRQQARLLLNKISSSDDYFVNFLFNELEEVLWTKTPDIVVREKIYYLSRVLGVELLSKYHRTYICNTVKKFFFNGRKISSCRKVWRKFKREILLEPSKYIVTIGTNKDLFTVLSDALNGENRKATQREKNLFKLPYVHIYKVDASDPYRACEFMRNFCDKITNVIKCEEHNVHFKLSKKVKCKKENHNNYHYTFETKDFIKKRRNKPENIAQKTYSFFFKNIDSLPHTLHKMLELHATAIQGTDVTNQLLNLWTILEIIVPFDRESGGDKSMQICNSIVAVLNVNYLYFMLVHFYNDVLNAGIDIANMLQHEIKGHDNIEKLLFVLNNSKHKKQIEQLLTNHPLLLTRFEYLSKVFADAGHIYDRLAAHSRRLRWHIMRIYRNRNLIIHEGENMPYLNALVDNLHFYVDMTLDFIWQKLFDGFQTIDSILTYAISLEGKRFTLIGCEFDRNGNVNRKKLNNLDRNLLKQVIIDHSFIREMEI